jgi:hypothetical protein
MPYYFHAYKEEFVNHLKKKFLPSTQILDVGAGIGVYGKLLKDYFTLVDAIEIHEPYTRDFELNKYYNHVMVADIKRFNYFNYDYIILGDVIGQMSIEEASEILFTIHNHDINCMVTVPYFSEKGIKLKKEYSDRLQSDLTHEVFLERYPMMELLWKDDNCGYYINY